MNNGIINNLFNNSFKTRRPGFRHSIFFHNFSNSVKSIFTSLVLSDFISLFEKNLSIPFPFCYYYAAGIFVDTFLVLELPKCAIRPYF